MFNHQAYAKRYREEVSEELIPFKYRDKCAPPYPAAVRLKAVECLMYQCSEAPFYESNLLWKQLEELERALLQEVAHNTPEYKAAKWGE